MSAYTGKVTSAAVNPDRQVPALIGGRRRPKRRRPSMAHAVLAATSRGGRR